ncbi:MAG: hypothetical protein JWR19_2208 [Pedosphaera sp.]|nr:hypothetical protein [Pedosphaera sp.]
MTETNPKIIRKKLVNITKEMDDEIKHRQKETRRTEMQIIQDAIMMRHVGLSDLARERLGEFAKERGVSLERGMDLLFLEMKALNQRVGGGRGRK